MLTVIHILDKKWLECDLASVCDIQTRASNLAFNTFVRCVHVVVFVVVGVSCLDVKEYYNQTLFMIFMCRPSPPRRHRECDMMYDI